MSGEVDETWMKMADSKLPPGGKPTGRRELCLHLWFKHVMQKDKLPVSDLKREMVKRLRSEKEEGKIACAWSPAMLTLGVPNPIEMLSDPFWFQILEIDDFRA